MSTGGLGVFLLDDKIKKALQEVDQRREERIMTERDPYDLTGRVALITGASTHGIGNESAKILAKHGAKVFLTARREERLKEAVAEIEALGGTAAYHVTDVSREEDCKAAVEACVEAFGRLDIMVLAARMSGRSVRPGDFEAMFDTENWKKLQGINLDGIFYMVKHGYAECAKNGVGAIVPIGSLASWHAAGSAAYTAAKGALRSLTQYFGKQFAPIGVRVNALYPGYIETEMTHPQGMDEIFEKIKPSMVAKIPIGRCGTVEDCANAVLYLASDASSFMTGQHLIVDGGELA